MRNGEIMSEMYVVGYTEPSARTAKTDPEPTSIYDQVKQASQVVGENNRIQEEVKRLEDTGRMDEAAQLAHEVRLNQDFVARLGGPMD